MLISRGDCDMADPRHPDALRLMRLAEEEIGRIATEAGIEEAAQAAVMTAVRMLGTLYFVVGFEAAMEALRTIQDAAEDEIMRLSILSVPTSTLNWSASASRSPPSRTPPTRRLPQDWHRADHEPRPGIRVARNARRVHRSEAVFGPAWPYFLIEAGAPHSSAEKQGAQIVLVDMSRTSRSQRWQIARTLWLLTC
jgi:hypothetical protein